MSQSDNQSTMAQVTRRQLREQEQRIRRAFVRMARMRAESERLQRRLAALEFRVVEGDRVRLTFLPYTGRAAPVSVLGWTFRRLPHKFVTLGWFVANNRTGRFFLRVNGHALAVIDGVVHDVSATGARTRVRTAWVATPTVPGDGAEIRI